MNIQDALTKVFNEAIGSGWRVRVLMNPTEDVLDVYISPRVHARLTIDAEELEDRNRMAATLPKRIMEAKREVLAALKKELEESR